jgi:hypothetical protein
MNIVDTKKLVWEVLLTELNPHVHSETIMARKQQSYTSVERDQIHAQARIKHNNCLFYWVQ